MQTYRNKDRKSLHDRKNECGERGLREREGEQISSSRIAANIPQMCRQPEKEKEIAELAWSRQPRSASFFIQKKFRLP